MTLALRKLGWGIMALFAVFIGGMALTNTLVPALRGSFVADLFARSTIPAYAHLAGGGIALAVGAFQFSLRLRFERPRVHRLLGRIHVVCVVVAGVAGGLLALRSSGGVTAHFGFGLLALCWVISALLAWTRAAAGDYEAHRAWMIRSYALCLAAVTLRLYLPASPMNGVPFETAYPVIAWLCWVPNLVVAEWLVVPSRLAPLEPPA